MNQTNTIKQDIILSNTIIGLSNYVNELSPDMIDKLFPLINSPGDSISRRFLRLEEIETT